MAAWAAGSIALGDSSTLADHSAEALETFRDTLLSFNELRGDSVTAMHGTHLLEQYGKLKVWVEQTGSSLRERGSLDESLRDDPDLREAVANAIQQLKVQLAMG